MPVAQAGTATSVAENFYDDDDFMDLPDVDVLVSSHQNRASGGAEALSPAEGPDEGPQETNHSSVGGEGTSGAGYLQTTSRGGAYQYSAAPLLPARAQSDFKPSIGQEKIQPSMWDAAPPSVPPPLPSFPLPRSRSRDSCATPPLSASPAARLGQIAARLAALAVEMADAMEDMDTMQRLLLETRALQAERKSLEGSARSEQDRGGCHWERGCGGESARDCSTRQAERVEGPFAGQPSGGPPHTEAYRDSGYAAQPLTEPHAGYGTRPLQTYQASHSGLAPQRDAFSYDADGFDGGSYAAPAPTWTPDLSHRAAAQREDASADSRWSAETFEWSASLAEQNRSRFGNAAFRGLQLSVINASLSGEDVFVLMPTGGGKSLCYQLPALMQPGVTIVISPLVSLIQDQVHHLSILGIPALCLSGSMDWEAQRQVYDLMARVGPEQEPCILFLTPEKLQASGRLQQALDSLAARGMLARVVIDEAHCVSQWGHGEGIVAGDMDVVAWGMDVVARGMGIVARGTDVAARGMDIAEWHTLQTSKRHVPIRRADFRKDYTKLSFFKQKSVCFRGCARLCSVLGAPSLILALTAAGTHPSR